MKRRIKRYLVKCQCGCGQRFRANRPDQLYKDHAHQQAAYRQRVRVEEQAAELRRLQQVREARERQRAEDDRKQAEARQAEWANRWQPHERQVQNSANHPKRGKVYPISEEVNGQVRWKMMSQNGKDYLAVTNNGKDEFWWLLSEYHEAKRKEQAANGQVSYPAYRS